MFCLDLFLITLYILLLFYLAFLELNAPTVAGTWKRSLILTLNLQV